MSFRGVWARIGAPRHLSCPTHPEHLMHTTTTIRSLRVATTVAAVVVATLAACSNPVAPRESASVARAGTRLVASQERLVSDSIARPAAPGTGTADASTGGTTPWF
jgi:hypothetical protein